MHTPVFHSSNPDIPNSDVLEVTCENLHKFFLSSTLGNASLFRMLSNEREEGKNKKEFTLKMIRWQFFLEI